MIEGDYETYQHLLQKEKERGEKSPAEQPPRRPPRRLARIARPRPRPPTKTKRKFAYRKAVEIEREIGELESEVAELEDLLGQPATWRDPVKAVGTQDVTSI